MQKLKETLESFSLSEDTRRKILNEDHPFGNQGTPFIPSEFKEIAQIALAGHFLVSAGTQQITVQPICVEFYYHEETEGGIKDPIVYHRNPKNGSPKSIFKLGILHNHVSGIDITFEKGTHPEDAIRASLLIREFSVDGNPPDSRSTFYMICFIRKPPSSMASPSNGLMEKKRQKSKLMCARTWRNMMKTVGRCKQKSIRNFSTKGSP